ASQRGRDLAAQPPGQESVSMNDTMTLERHATNADPSPRIIAENVSVFYGDKQALFDVSIALPERAVTAFIGPSGCGKSTFLRCFNRMNDTIEGCRTTGSIHLDGEDICRPSLDVVELRARIGMVF